MNEYMDRINGGRINTCIRVREVHMGLEENELVLVFH